MCDGEIDCPGGEDERECRRIASLFSKEDGWKQEGKTINSEEETSVASEEECAHLCYYSKKCCESFSTRPGKEGKKDICLLSTVFENQVRNMFFLFCYTQVCQVFDALVQKSSWNHHRLNQTEPREKCRPRREVISSLLDGLRLKNTRRDVLGRIVEVSVNGVWGGLCDDTFGMAEANIVCKQTGYHLGAQEVIKKAGSSGRGGGGVVHGSLDCKGEERSLSDCELDQRQQCRPGDVAGVVCRQVEEGSCQENEFHCSTGECVHLDNLCNGETMQEDVYLGRAQGALTAGMAVTRTRPSAARGLVCDCRRESGMASTPGSWR